MLTARNGKGNALPRRATGFLYLLFFVCAQGASSAHGKAGSNWKGYTQSGKASYYAAKFQSRKTASGELYDKAKKTAAHKKLPFGTKVSVTNTKNGKSVVVRINDRGPFVKDRIIDLSGSAFGSIGSFDAGVIYVRIEVIR